MHSFFFHFITLSILIVNPKTPKDYLWENRILIIQTHESNSIWFEEKLIEELKDRKLLVLQFKGNILTNINSNDEIDPSKFLEKLKFKNTETSQWVLIGLDGGVKNSGNQMPTPSGIFKIIDAMPMRQSEIRIIQK